MGFAMNDSFVLKGGYDGSHIRRSFWNWWHRGYNNSFRNQASGTNTRDSVGLGGNISLSLRAQRRGTRVPDIYVMDANDSGNGSLMRFGPVSVFLHAAPQNWFQSPGSMAYNIPRESSKTTHPGAISAEASAYLAFVCKKAFDRPADDASTMAEFLDACATEYITQLETMGDPIPNDGVFEMLKLLRPSGDDNRLAGTTEACWEWRLPALPIQETMQRRRQGPRGQYNGYPVLPCYFGSYCMDGLAMALHACYNNNNFLDAVDHAVNLLGDADSTGSMTGQIAGSFYGYTGIQTCKRDDTADQPETTGGQVLIDAMNQHCDHDIALRALMLYKVSQDYFSGEVSRRIFQPFDQTSRTYPTPLAPSQEELDQQPEGPTPDPAQVPGPEPRPEPYLTQEPPAEDQSKLANWTKRIILGGVLLASVTTDYWWPWGSTAPTSSGDTPDVAGDNGHTVQRTRCRKTPRTPKTTVQAGFRGNQSCSPVVSEDLYSGIT